MRRLDKILEKNVRRAKKIWKTMARRELEFLEKLLDSRKWNEVDHKAITESIDRWRANVEADQKSDVSIGSEGCPLCAIYIMDHYDYYRDCDGCPIAKTTGLGDCRGTPYGKAQMAFLEWSRTLADADYKSSFGFER
jgi:hypothetical protein